MSRLTPRRPCPASVCSVSCTRSASSTRPGCSSSVRPVEVALPVYVAQDLQASAGLLGAYWTSFGVGALLAALLTGLRARNLRRVILLIVAGWGACLLPFVFAPVGVTLVCFALGGLIYGPLIPLTYALFQSSTTSAHLPRVLAARSAIVMLSTPLGTLIGGPLVEDWRGGHPYGLRRRNHRARRAHQRSLDAPEAAKFRRLWRMTLDHLAVALCAYG